MDKPDKEAPKLADPTPTNEAVEEVKQQSMKQGWSLVDEAAKFFVDIFIRGGLRMNGKTSLHPGDYHAVFAFGTVVRVYLPQDKEDEEEDSWDYLVGKEPIQS